MTHHLLRSQLGAPVAPAMITTIIKGPVASSILSSFDLKGSTKSLLKDLQSASEDSTNLQIPGIDPEDVQNFVLDAAFSGGTDPKKFMERFFALGGAIACASVGALALAPLCAAGGKVIGEAVAGLQVKPVGPGPSAEGEALAAQLAADQAYLKQQRDGLYYSLSARFNGAPEAMKQVEAILQEFYAGYGCKQPQPDGSCLFNPDSTPCLQGNVEGWTNKAGGCSSTNLGPYAGGFMMPFYVTDACALLGQAYSDACGEWWEWEIDYSAQTSGGQKFMPKPGWAEALLKAIQSIMRSKGIDVDVAFGQLWAQMPQWQQITSVPLLMSTMYVALKQVLWPSLQLALEKRLQGVIVETTIKANVKLVASIESFSKELAKRSGCNEADCLNSLRKDVKALAMKLPGKNLDEIAVQIDEQYPPEKTEQPSKVKVVVGLGLAGALVYGLHRFIKRYV